MTEAQMQEFYNRLGHVELNLTEMRAKFDSFFDGMAPRLWVQEELGPIRNSITELNHAIQVLTEKQSSLYATHEKLILDEAERKKEVYTVQLATMEQQKVAQLAALEQETAAKIKALERQTMGGVWRNWLLPTFVAIAVVAAAGAAATPLLRAVLHYVFKLPQ